MEKILLPRNYLSWSQMTCWLSNPERYRREYFEHSEKLDNKYLRFGKGMAKMIEEGKHKELLPDLVVYDCPEFEIRTTVNGVPILSYLDSYDSKSGNFLEYKTGKHPWDQSKVQKHDQLLFYATALKFGLQKTPEYCDLVWIETKEGTMEVDDFWHENENIINVTGRITSFHREFDERELERMENLIVKVAEEISEAYQNFIKEI
jgi:hypothetical protein